MSHKGLCFICQRKKKLECSIWYHKPFQSKNGSVSSGKMCCKECLLSYGEDGVVSLAKQSSNVTWSDLENLGLIDKFKGSADCTFYGVGEK